MKVKFRTVLGKTFELDVEGDTKVADVKAKIQETQGDDFNKDSLNVIYQGKILKDDATLAESNVSEAGFCVVMAMKKKAAAEPKPEAPAAAAAPAPVAAPAPAEAPAAAPAAAAPAPAAAPAAAAAAAAPAGGDAAPEDLASELATGSHLEERVTQLMEMGFPREEVQRAMRAAFNNAERAVEYLMTGIPEGLEVPPVARAPPAAGGAPAQAAVPQQPAAPINQPFNMFAPAPAGGTAAAGGGQGGPLDALRNNPQFQALKAIVQQNPQTLNPMLTELGRSNPALLQQIQANQGDFLAMLNEPVEGGAEQIEAALQQMMGGMEGMEEGAGGQGVQIELTQEEADAVERLVAMGFDRELCLEAFLICDKNETLAANYLLENAMNM